MYELLSPLNHVLLKSPSVSFLVSFAGHEPGFCMMCTMQNHIIQVFANSGNVIKPIGVLNELKSKWMFLKQEYWKRALYKMFTWNKW